MLHYPDGATPLDPDDIEELKHGNITTRAELDHLEQGNIQMGLDWLSRIRTKDILNEEFTCELHRRLFGEVWEWAGRFRTSGKNIGVDASQIAMQLRMLLDDVKYWIENSTYTEYEIAVRLHYRLVWIHVFPNGNGRHARIMADAVLTKIMGREPIDWSGGHDLQAMNERRKQYIAALKTADKGDLGPLFEFAGIQGRK